MAIDPNNKKWGKLTMSSTKIVKQYGSNARELLGLGVAGVATTLIAGQFGDQFLIPFVKSTYSDGALFGIVFASLFGAAFARAKGKLATLVVVAGAVAGAYLSDAATLITRGNDFFTSEATIQRAPHPPLVSLDELRR